MFTYFNNQCHGESVYNLIKTTEAPPPNPPMYRSRYSQYVRDEARCNKVGCYRTMGTPKECLCPPDNYLRKNSRAPITIRPPGIPKVNLSVDAKPACETSDSPGDTEGTNGEIGSLAPEIGSCCPPKCRYRACCNPEPKPAVPNSCCGLGLIPKGDRDFIRANALKVVRQPARVPEPRFVFHRNGHTADWETSGYPRKYVCKKDFGQVPEYLDCIKERLRIEETHRKWTLEKPKREARDKCRHMQNEERDALLCGLKTKWEEVFKEYQSMPLLIDTAAKVKQRYSLEQRLRELERNIQMMERHDHIFVAETDSSFYLA